jgi:hypothetical protein
MFDSPGKSTRGKILPLPTTDKVTRQRDGGTTNGFISRLLGMVDREAY